MAEKYDSIAKFYDDVIGRGKESNLIPVNALKAYGSKIKTVLELGCGTGSVLVDLKDRYKVFGIDISGEMLKIAQKKIPSGKFYKQDISRFKLNEKFNAVLCIYDTINHLTKFSDWIKVFKNVHSHLEKDGIFLFDVNTINKLEYLAYVKSFFHTFKKNYLIANITRAGNNIYNWELNVFEKTRGNNFKLYKQTVPEAAFKIRDIKAELRKYFVIKKTFSEGLEKPTDSAERVYFLCQKKK